jgi:hypothetical protein
MPRSRRTALMAFVKTTPDGALQFWIAKELESPNRHRGGHWSTRHKVSQAWERAIASAVGKSWTSWSLITGQHRTPKRGMKPTYARERRRVVIERHVPSRRRFIKDDDNLAFSSKEIRDALKRLGLICEDSRAWLECPAPEQKVSDDGAFWTVVTIARVDAQQQAA